jgi:hypothetical protein
METNLLGKQAQHNDGDTGEIVCVFCADKSIGIIIKLRTGKLRCAEWNYWKIID